MANKKKTPVGDTVEVNKDDLTALMDAFDRLIDGQADLLSCWLEDDYGMEEAVFDQHLRALGDAMGRDFGIL